MCDIQDNHGIIKNISLKNIHAVCHILFCLISRCIALSKTCLLMFTYHFHSPTDFMLMPWNSSHDQLV